MEKSKAVEAGMAFVLISLLVSYFIDSPLWKEYTLLTGIVLLLLNMIIPKLFKFPGKWWFKLGEVLGKLSSTILLSGIFLLVVTPIGLFRKLLGKDPLRVKEWKKSQNSVLVTREQIYSKEDLKFPF